MKDLERQSKGFVKKKSRCFAKIFASENLQLFANIANIRKIGRANNVNILFVFVRVVRCSSNPYSILSIN